MKKITLDSAKKEGIGALGAATGVIGASIVMKLINGTGKVPAWLLPVIALAGGYGVQLATDNQFLKDMGKGLLVAGTLDGAKKLADAYGASIPGISLLTDNIPALSGANDPSTWGGAMFSNDMGDGRSLRGIGAYNPSAPAALRGSEVLQLR